jgi:transposase-like protein
MARSADPYRSAVWRGRLQRFLRSGLSVARFCAQERVSVASFYQWRKKLGAQALRRPPRPSQPVSEMSSRAVGEAAFQPVTVVPGVWGVGIELPGGTRIEVRAEELAAVRAVIAEVARCDRSAEAASEPFRRAQPRQGRRGAASC